MKKKLNRFFSIFILALFLFIVFLVNNYFYIFSIKTFPDKLIIFQNRVSTGQKISFAYNHSVSQTPVWEFFEIDKYGKLILTETHFLDHGAGLPYAAFGEELFVSEDHTFKILNMYRKIELPLYYRIYKNRDNIFKFDKKEIKLSNIVGNALLIINVNRQNRLVYFLNYFKNLGGAKLDEQFG